ncbi:MAG TPA: sigma-70 family RNA polymerase sigma factor [Jiangellaceae bacterium]
MTAQLPGAARIERYERLARDLGPRVLGYLVRRTDQREDAADLLAEVLTTAWRRIDAVPPDPDDALPWLLGVARKTLANHQRGVRRRQALADWLRDHLGAAVTPAPGEDALAVRQVLGRLDPDDCELLTLTAWDGLTAEQASAVVKVSAAAVRKRLERARRAAGEGAGRRGVAITPRVQVATAER